MKSPLLAAALIASLTVPTAIAGTGSIEQFELKVEVDRAALDDPLQISDEYQRIEDQVEDECQDTNTGAVGVRNYFAVRSCVNMTMDSTVQSIDHAALTAFHVEERLG